MDKSSTHTFNNFIEIKVKLESAEYQKFILKMTMRLPIIIAIYTICSILLIWSLIVDAIDWVSYVMIFFLICVPFAFYLFAGIMYKSTKAVHEPLSYKFSRDIIEVHGVTFTSSFQWAHIQKIREIDKSIVLQINQQLALVIPEKAFASVSDLEAFKNLCLLANKKD